MNNSGKSAGRTAVTVILSILLCAALLAGTVLTAARNTVSSENIAKLLSQIDLGSIRVPTASHRTARTQASQSAGRAVTMTRTPAASPVRTAEESGDQSLADMILDALKDQEGIEGLEDVSSDAINDVLGQDFVQDFLGDVTEDYVDAIVSGEEPPEDAGLSADKVTDFLVEHQDDLNAAMSEAGIDAQIKIDEDVVRQSLSEQLDKVMPSVSEIREQYAGPLSAVRAVMSSAVLIAVWAVAAALAVLILLINIKRISGGLLGLGIPALIVGALLLAPVAVSGLLTGDNAAVALVRALLRGPLTLIGAVTGGAGLVLTVAGAVAGAVGKRKTAA